MYLTASDEGSGIWLVCNACGWRENLGHTPEPPTVFAESIAHSHDCPGHSA